MSRLLVLLLLPTLAFAGCASPSESRDDGTDDDAADCPADNATAGDPNATADGGMETDECAPAPASSNMCVEGAEDCEDTVANETVGTYG